MRKRAASNTRRIVLFNVTKRYKKGASAQVGTGERENYAACHLGTGSFPTSNSGQATVKHVSDVAPDTFGRETHSRQELLCVQAMRQNFHQRRGVGEGTKDHEPATFFGWCGSPLTPKKHKETIYFIPRLLNEMT